MSSISFCVSMTGSSHFAFSLSSSIFLFFLLSYVFAVGIFSPFNQPSWRTAARRSSACRIAMCSSTAVAGAACAHSRHTAAAASPSSSQSLQRSSSSAAAAAMTGTCPAGCGPPYHLESSSTNLVLRAEGGPGLALVRQWRLRREAVRCGGPGGGSSSTAARKCASAAGAGGLGGRGALERTPGFCGLGRAVPPEILSKAEQAPAAGAEDGARVGGAAAWRPLTVYPVCWLARHAAAARWLRRAPRSGPAPPGCVPVAYGVKFCGGRCPRVRLRPRAVRHGQPDHFPCAPCSSPLPPLSPSSFFLFFFLSFFCCDVGFC